MPMFRKTGCAALVACCMALGTTGAHAALVNFTLTGTTDEWTIAPNVFGVGVGDTVTVTGTFDDSVLSGGTGTVSFDQSTGNTLAISFPNVSFTEQSDSNYTLSNSRPNLTFNGGAFTGFNFSAEFDSGDELYPHAFDSQNLFFFGWEYGYDLTVSGVWGDFSMTPVPVPAAVWLLGSGLIGLAGVAKRKRTT